MKNNTVYVVGNNLYINLTNRCSNRCEFCVRYYDNPIYGDLWLQDEPTAENVILTIQQNFDLNQYDEVVFCGYGEPTYRWEAIKLICDYIHSQGKKTRINTNGQGNKINGRDITQEMCQYIDSINVSLNATDSVKYDKICHSDYGLQAFDILIDFVCKCVQHQGNVCLSVVDCIGEQEIAKAKQICDKIGCKLKVRELL